MLDITGSNASSTIYDVAFVASKGARDYQEDTILSNFALGQRHGFVVIADGMGGHSSGDIASTLVASEIFAHFKMHSKDIEGATSNLPLVLREGAEKANDRLTIHTTTQNETKGMGSTLLAPVISGDKLSWISIGDSPLLLFRDGALRMLNKDHSMAPQIDLMVKSGALKPEEARNHPDRNVLTSVLNGDDIVKIDCPAAPVTLLPGDLLIAATDGLQFLSNAVIANILMTHQKASASLIAAGLLGTLEDLNDPQQDNVSFAIVKIGENVTERDALSATDMPVLAVADTVDSAPLILTPASQPEPVAEEPPKKTLRTYFYRGKEYTKEE